MHVTTDTSPGGYAKGIAKRQQILSAVLAAYSSPDGREPSFKQIAQLVGLSERGMNHYFGSKSELLVSVLAERDRLSGEVFDGSLTIEQSATLIAARNRDTPRLLRLFLELAAASSDPAHPAHDFFLQRYARLHEQLVGLITRTTGVDAPTAAWRARILVASWDGLQIQWLLDPTFDLQDALLRLGTEVVLRA